MFKKVKNSQQDPYKISFDVFFSEIIEKKLWYIYQNKVYSLKSLFETFAKIVKEREKKILQNIK